MAPLDLEEGLDEKGECFFHRISSFMGKKRRRRKGQLKLSFSCIFLSISYSSVRVFGCGFYDLWLSYPNSHLCMFLTTLCS